MKSTLMTVAIVSISTLSSTLAQARTTVCGQLVTQEAGPQCLAGQICPHFLQLRYAIQDLTGNSSELTLLTVPGKSLKSGVLMKELGALGNKDVCASGVISGNQLAIDDIRQMETIAD